MSNALLSQLRAEREARRGPPPSPVTHAAKKAKAMAPPEGAEIINLSSEDDDHDDLSLVEYQALMDQQRRGELSLFVIDEVAEQKVAPIMEKLQLVTKRHIQNPSHAVYIRCCKRIPEVKVRLSPDTASSSSR
jgi:hypothetical protein